MPTSPPWSSRSVEGFGFTDLTYAVTADIDRSVTSETRGFVYTTKPSAWVRRYDQMAYMEVYPRSRTWRIAWASPRRP